MLHFILGMRIFIILLGFQIFTSQLWSKDTQSLGYFEARVKGFEDHEKAKIEIENKREGSKDAFLNEKKKAQTQREKDQSEYLTQKSKVKKVKPEDTPGYEEYLLKKWQRQNDQQKMAEADRYVESQKKARADSRQSRFEIREFGLENSEKNRIAYNKRKFVPKSAAGGNGGSSSGGSGGGSSDFGGGGFGGGNYEPPAFDDNNFLDNNDIPPPPPPPPPPSSGDFNGYGNFQAPSMAPPDEPPPPSVPYQ